MRLHRASQFLLLASSSLAHALELSAKEQALSSNPDLRKRDAAPELLEGRGSDFVPAQPAASIKAKESLRPYRGTEDAPVDGLDGKPHAGPFVDTTPEETRKAKADVVTTTVKSRPTNLDKWTQAGSEEWRLEDIPEKNDGVMNDENRVGPKKGTDGTAGGISEKEKERRLKGYAENKPQEPKTAPELPHSEQEWLEKEGQEKSKQSTGSAGKEGEKSSGSEKLVEQPKKKESEYHGLEKPANLPDKPHNIPHPEPKIATEPPPDSGSSGSRNWLTDTMPYTEGKTNPQKAPAPKLAPDGSIIPGSDDESWHEWFHSFVLSFTMILFSEIGDKTFLVAALMAMRHPRILVFSAAFGALIVMTVLSAVLGHAFPALLPKRLTMFAAAVLFLVFGARSLREGLAMPKDSGVGEEMKEVEAELEEKEHTMAREASRRRSSLTPYALESGARGRQTPLKPAEPSPPSSRSPSPSNAKKSYSDRMSGLTNLLSLVLSPAWVQTFVMTFLGEWGDRSQIATIAMAAGQDYWWVTLGAITGHACCTGLAVVGGRALAGRVSMRVGKLDLKNPQDENVANMFQSRSAAPSPS